jgi:hypothetical protein
LIFRRHVAPLEVVDDLFPNFDVFSGESFRELVEPDVSFVLVGIVALDAVLSEKRQRLRLRMSMLCAR